MSESAWDELTEPFTISVFDKDLNPLFPLPLRGGPGMNGLTNVTVALAVDEVSVATIEMPLAHPRAYDLQAEGTRVRIEHRLAGHLLSGPIVAFKASKGQDNRGGSTITFTVQDDLRLLWRVLGWVAPTKGISLQQSDDSSAQYRISGKPAEYVVKRVFTDNAVNRLGIPVTVATSKDRGGTIYYATRNHTLASKLFPAVTNAGIGVTIRQVDYGSPDSQSVVLDCYEFPTHAAVLTPDSPQVADWGFEMTGPEAVCGVVGGQGQGNQRVFRSATSSELGAWGRLYGGEIFDDQRQESLTASLDFALADELADKASKTQINLSLIGSDRWAYGRSWRVGDFIRWRVSRYSSVLTTQITSANLSWTPSEGYKATSATGVLGKYALARTIARLTRQVHDLRAGW